ncbi:DUF4259 domain-containing protein [Capnocytophaga canimorsus]
MGVWGITNLENDTAQDWLVEVGEDFVSAQEYVEMILQEEDFIDDEESFITLAVLELMEQHLSSSDFDKNAFLQKFPKDFIFSVIKASKKILYFENHSELRELWQESDEYEQWKTHQDSLISCIKYFLEKYEIRKIDNARPGTTWSLLDD